MVRELSESVCTGRAVFDLSSPVTLGAVVTPVLFVGRMFSTYVRSEIVPPCMLPMNHSQVVLGVVPPGVVGPPGSRVPALSQVGAAPGAAPSTGEAAGELDSKLVPSGTSS